MRGYIIQIPIDASRMNGIAQCHRAAQLNKCNVWAVVANFVQVQRMAKYVRDIEVLSERFAEREVTAPLANRDPHVRLVNVGEAMRCRQQDKLGDESRAACEDEVAVLAEKNCCVPRECDVGVKAVNDEWERVAYVATPRLTLEDLRRPLAVLLTNGDVVEFVEIRRRLKELSARVLRCCARLNFIAARHWAFIEFACNL